MRRGYSGSATKSIMLHEEQLTQLWVAASVRIWTSFLPPSQAPQSGPAQTWALAAGTKAMATEARRRIPRKAALVLFMSYQLHPKDAAS